MAETNAAMGQRLRELRLRRGLQQSEVARRLKISPAYLSLIEKGKRVVQLPLLFQALELYDVAVEDFMGSLGERRVDDGLARLLDEPLLRSLNLSEEDLASISAEPRMVATITALFNLYKNTRSQLDHVTASIAQRERQADDDSVRFDYSPYDEVTDFLEQNDNWFGALEDRAQQFRRDCAFKRRVTSDDLERALLEQVGVRVHKIPDPVDSSVIRTWNAEERVLTVLNDLFEQRLKFQFATTIALGLFDEEKLHKPILEGYRGQHAETRKLIKIHLANYFAGALLLPYPEFYRDVTSTRYDVELLAQLFESSYETVAHRMCNLSDPRRRGVPMHFVESRCRGQHFQALLGRRYSVPAPRRLLPQDGRAFGVSDAQRDHQAVFGVSRRFDVFLFRQGRQRAAAGFARQGHDLQHRPRNARGQREALRLRRRHPIRGPEEDGGARRHDLPVL